MYPDRAVRPGAYFPGLYNELEGGTPLHNRKSEKEKMLTGELYLASDPELVSARERADRMLRRYNSEPPGAAAEEILRELLGGLGENTIVRAPFYCDYGSNIYLGNGVFINFNAVFLDVMPVRIGDGTQVGPNVQFYSADHPRDAETRRRGLEFGKPVTVGKNVWIGGGAILLPGVSVGDDAIIGAGAVVTRDVAAGTTVVGNPARVRHAGF